jgi:4-amino-4-deoxy-L-arabinose transferase-like glycosyltransferase
MSDAVSSFVTDANPGLPRLISSPRRFLTALALLFVAQVVVRLFTSPMPNQDESWQIVLAQEWSLGYASHPPLYTWLQIPFFRLLGESILALALLKNLLLFLLYMFTYRAARLVSGRHETAAWATLSLLLIPQIAWESQRDLTHSVLLSAATAGALWTFLSLVERPAAGKYALLGLCAGAALLAKYNAGVFIAAALAAALCSAPYRARILDRRMWVAALMCAAVTVPHGWWAWHHAQEAFASTSKLEFRPAIAWSTAAWRVPDKVLTAFLPNMIPALVLCLLAQGRKALSAHHPLTRWLLWTMGISVVVIAATMLAAKATSLRGRWFQPLFVLTPLLLAAQIQAVPRWLLRLVPALAAAGVLVVMALMPIHVWRGGGSRNQDLTAGTLKLALDGAARQVAAADFVIADTFWVGGAIRHATGKRVVTPGAVLPGVREAKRLCVVFEIRRSEEMPRVFKDAVESIMGRPVRLKNTFFTPPNEGTRTGKRLVVAELE